MSRNCIAASAAGPCAKTRRNRSGRPFSTDRRKLKGNPKLEVLVTFDLPQSEKLSLEESLALVAKQGYQRLLLDGQILRLEDIPSRFTSHVSRPASFTVIQDRLSL